MKNLFFILALLFSVSAIAQVQDTILLAGKYSFSQSGGGSGFWQASGNFTDESGLFEASNIQVGDLLCFTDAGVGYYLPITEIVSATPPSITIKVSNVGITNIVSLPTTLGAICRPSANVATPSYIAGLPNPDLQTILGYLNKKVTSELGEVGWSKLSNPVKDSIRGRKDTTVVVLSENKVVDFDFADTRRYSNVYFVGKGVTDTAQLIFLNPPAPEQFGTVFHMKADSGGVALRFMGSQGANNKNGYFLRPGQRAEIRALYDAVAGFELWEVVIAWDSIVQDKSIYTDNGTIPAGMRTLTMSGSLLLNNPTTATGSSTKLFDEVRQKLPGNSSKWYSRSSFYEARSTVAIRGYPTWYELVQGNGGSMYEWYNGIGWDTTNNAFHYLYGGRYSSSFLSFSGTRPASGTAYQNTPAFEFKYSNGNGLSTSEVINVAATTGLLFSLRQDGRITFGNNGASYYFPITAPSATNSTVNILKWTGNGTTSVPSFDLPNNLITGTARVIPYLNTGGRLYTGNDYFKLDTNTTSGAMARVRLLINNPTGLAGEGDSYSVLSVAAGDGASTMSILNMGDQALTNASVGYNSVMQLYRSGGTFSAKTNLSNGNTVGHFAWRGQANNGSRALGHIGLDYTGDGTSINSSVYGSSAVSGTVVKGWLLDNQSRFWLGSGADDYYMPTTAPTSATGSKSALEYEGTGSSTIPKWMPKRYGAATTSTDASGDIVVTFSAAMPDATYLAFVSFISPDNTGLNYSYSLHSVTSAGLKIRVMNASTGAAITSTSVIYNLKVEDF